MKGYFIRSTTGHAAAVLAVSLRDALVTFESQHGEVESHERFKADVIVSDSVASQLKVHWLPVSIRELMIEGKGKSQDTQKQKSYQMGWRQ